jgi:hypothetical protein
LLLVASCGKKKSERVADPSTTAAVFIRY